MTEQQDPAREQGKKNVVETEQSGAGYGNNAGEQGAGAGDVEDET